MFLTINKLYNFCKTKREEGYGDSKFIYGTGYLANEVSMCKATVYQDKEHSEDDYFCDVIRTDTDNELADGKEIEECVLIK